MDTKERLDNTIKAVANILEKNKDKESVKDAYNDIKKLKENRSIK